MLYVLQMLSKVSADEVSMHYFENCCQLLGALSHTLTKALPLDPLGLPSFRPPHCPPLEKILRAPMSVTKDNTMNCLESYISVTSWFSYVDGTFIQKLSNYHAHPYYSY